MRILASHLREVIKLLVLDHRCRSDVREFVGALPQQARDARDEIENALDMTHSLREGVMLYEDMKRVRDDTFHYSRDKNSEGRLRSAMNGVSNMRGEYLLGADDHRESYADLVAVTRMHPYGDSEEEQIAFAREMHEAIIGLNERAVTFIPHAQAHYLCRRRRGCLYGDGSHGKEAD
ncbi:MAG: hypothetical protein LC808_03745 [Actinobacteria bacterium]|nr:hypothetical protein [Actinomycetota bacterium]